MEKSKRVLIVLIILIVMIAIIGIMLLNINKKPETIKGNTQSTTNCGKLYYLYETNKWR